MKKWLGVLVLERREQVAVIVLLLLFVVCVMARHHRDAQPIPAPVEEIR